MKLPAIKNKSSAFTVNEFIIVMVMILLLGIITVSNFNAFLKRSQVDTTVQEFANSLKLAQSRTLSSEGNSQYGVYINTAVTPHQFVLFKGATYATRTVSEDQTYTVGKNAEFYNITLGGGNEVNFSRLTGASSQSGNVTVRSTVDSALQKLVYIDNAGVISFSASLAPSDSSRIKDTRHMHFDYSRFIDTLTESITLDFNSGQVIQTFPISAYLVASQIQWQQTISVGGTDQIIQIHTHRLNNLDTQFSIHRDRRFNDKSLKITISGDAGSIIEYTADGLSTNYTSSYVSNVQAQ